MTAVTYSDVWNLDVFFKGGSDSQEFKDHLVQTEEVIKQFHAKVNSWTPKNSPLDSQY
ncbi:hypothetical protein AM1BK_06280 [Neobacillus kokaensis]|uniref:Uncharacterized protein n=1 Tax=Neobacillus kokaensis TaxID=2759023 RepID=A0ABQ3MWN4_9BACI|nr:hypothetical protein AM1BK_06280 [Neobacillus kokaensis]